MVRALGMLIAGLPCLPWFIDSTWNLAFGVLPPYWAAKASGWPASTAPGGHTSSSASSTTWR